MGVESDEARSLHKEWNGDEVKIDVESDEAWSLHKEWSGEEVKLDVVVASDETWWGSLYNEVKVDVVSDRILDEVSDGAWSLHKEGKGDVVWSLHTEVK